MSKSRNFNLFAGDRAYQLTRLLSFRSVSTEEKFQAETFVRTKYFLQGYVLINLAFIIWTTFLSDCFNYYRNCRYTGLSILSMVLLMLTFLFIRTKNQFLVRILLLLPSLYIHLELLDSYTYYQAIHLIVIQTTFTSCLTLNTWKHHVVFSIGSYALLTLTLKYLEAEYIVNGCFIKFLREILIYTIIPLAIVTYIEKGRRERWVLLETFKKSERSFIALIEKVKSPVFVVDSSHRIIFANQKALNIIRQHVHNLPSSIPITKLNINFNSLLTNASKKVFANTLNNLISEESITKRISLLDPKDSSAETVQQLKNTNLSNPNEEDLLQSSDNVYEVHCARTLWKNSHAYLISTEEITNSIKVQSVISSNYTQLISNLQNYIAISQGVFENLPNLTLFGMTYRPLLQAISNMDSLLFSLLNTSTVYDMGNEKLKTQNELFDIRDLMVYLFEIMSVRSSRQKNEMVLKFEGGFPDQVTGNSLRFAQLVHNFMMHIIENSKDSKIEVQCNVKTVLTQGKYLLEFDVEFAENDNLKFQDLQILDIDEPGFEFSVDIIKKNDLETSFLLIRPLLVKMNGLARVTQSDNIIKMRFELPFDNNSMSPSQNRDKGCWNLPSLSKFNLTNTKTKVNKNMFTWSAKPLPISNDVPINEAIQSPFIMKERLTERIKQQFLDSHSLATPSQQIGTGIKSQSRSAANYEDFKKNKMNLMKFAGKEPEPSVQKEPEPVKPEGVVTKIKSDKEEKKVQQKRSALQALAAGDTRQSPKEGPKELFKSGPQNDAISLNIKRQKEKQIEEQKTTTSASATNLNELTIEPIKEETDTDEKESKSNHNYSASEPKPETLLHPPVETKDEATQIFRTPEIRRTLDIDNEYLTRGISRVKRGRRKSKSISSKEILKVTEPEEPPSQVDTLKVNNYKPIRPSFFSPSSPTGEIMESSQEEIEQASVDEKRITSNNHSIDDQLYFVTRSRLKANENNLKIAVANILLGILTIYTRVKKTSAVTSHSKLSEDQKKEEDISSQLAIPEESKKKDSFDLGSSEAQDKELNKIIDSSFLNGKLKSQEFLDRIVDLMASRISIEKNTKEFMAFLDKYAKIIEKKFYDHDFKIHGKGSLITLDDEEEKADGRIILTSFLGDEPQKHPFGILKRKNSDDSIFSLNSDAGERNLNLSERMLVTPAIMALLRNKGQLKGSKAINEIRHSLLEKENDSSATSKDFGHQKNAKSLDENLKLTEEFNSNLKNDEPHWELSIKEVDQETRQQELLPFSIAFDMLPPSMQARTHHQRREWRGEAVVFEEPEKNFALFEDFTILVIDDNNFILKGLELSSSPYRRSLDWAKNGLEGFTKYKDMMEKNYMYHLIFMDVVMPVCDGLEATEMIRNYESRNGYPRTYICAVSSNEDEGTRRKCLEAGMDDYCCKPIEAQTLSRLILSRCQTLNLSPRTDN